MLSTCCCCLDDMSLVVIIIIHVFPLHTLCKFFYFLILIHSLIRYIRKELKRVLSSALWTVSAVRCSLKLFLRSFKLSLYNLLISYCHSFSNPKNSVDSHLQFPRSSRSVCRKWGSYDPAVVYVIHCGRWCDLHYSLVLEQ